MKNLWSLTQTVFTGLGGWLGYFLGGWDGLIVALTAFITVDYLTGIMCAVATHKLSSEVGFIGICRKMLILLMVGVAQVLDSIIFGQAGVLRTAVAFYYISNEGISILENSAKLGLPIPKKLQDALEQLHEKEGEKDGGG